jgi:hypothetical protein
LRFKRPRRVRRYTVSSSTSDEDLRPEDEECLPDLLFSLSGFSRLQEVLDREDPTGARRTCLSVGDDTSGVLLVGAVAGRFERVADVSYERAEGCPWLRADVLRSVAPEATTCSIEGDLFDDRSLTAALQFNDGAPYEFCYLEKTLHHLRLNRCKFAGDKDHTCGGNDCVGRFDASVVFSRLFEFAKTIIVSEYHYIGKDEDKASARGGMLTLDEVDDAFTWLLSNATVRIVSPIDAESPRRANLAQHLERTEYFLIAATRKPAGRARARQHRVRG